MIGERVRAVWNPYARLWEIYGIRDDFSFSTGELTLAFASMPSEMRPSFAPHGTSSVVGLIDYDRSECLHDAYELYRLPNCSPAKLYFVDRVLTHGIAPPTLTLSEFRYGRLLWLRQERIFTCFSLERVKRCHGHSAI